MAKRVLFCVGGFRVFGSETKMLYIMRYLKQQGYEVQCITQGWSDDRFGKLLEEEGIPYYRIKLGFLYLRKPAWTLDTIRHYPKAILGLKRILKNFHPDVVYHNSYKNLFFMAPYLAGQKVVFHVGDIHPISSLNKFIFRFIQPRVYKIIASSEFIKKNLQELGITKPIPVVPNGIELPKDLFIKTDSAEVFKVAMVAQLIERKGQKDLIQAVKFLQDLGHEVHAYFYGSGDETYLSYLMNLSEELNIQKYVFFKGYENSKNKIYAGIGACVVGSRSEAFGISAVEPMFYKIPVVATNVGGLKEIIDHGKDGFLYKPGDIESLALYLQSLILDQGLRERIIYNAFHKATEKFTVKNMVNSIIKEFP